jgi:hypothetical protein
LEIVHTIIQFGIAIAATPYSVSRRTRRARGGKHLSPHALEKFRVDLRESPDRNKHPGNLRSRRGAAIGPRPLGVASGNALQRHPPEESSTVFSSRSVEAAKRKLKKIKQWSDADILCNCSSTGTAICDAVNFYGLRGEPNRDRQRSERRNCGNPEEYSVFHSPSIRARMGQTT